MCGLNLLYVWWIAVLPSRNSGAQKTDHVHQIHGGTKHSIIQSTNQVWSWIVVSQQRKAFYKQFMKYLPNLWLDGSVVINRIQNLSALEYVYRASSDFFFFLFFWVSCYCLCFLLCLCDVYVFIWLSSTKGKGWHSSPHFRPPRPIVRARHDPSWTLLLLSFSQTGQKKIIVPQRQNAYSLLVGSASTGHPQRGVKKARIMSLKAQVMHYCGPHQWALLLISIC